MYYFDSTEAGKGDDPRTDATYDENFSPLNTWR